MMKNNLININNNLDSIKLSPLDNYLEIIRTSFNNNNYIWMVVAQLKNNKILIDEVNYSSGISGYYKNQKRRPGNVFRYGVGNFQVYGITKFLNTLEDAFNTQDVNVISTLITSDFNYYLSIDFYKNKLYPQSYLQE